MERLVLARELRCRQVRRLFVLGATAGLLLACGSKSPAQVTGEDAGSGQGMDSGADAIAADSGAPSPDDASIDEDVSIAGCMNDPRCQATGTQCSGTEIVTCALGPQGCYVVTATNTCPPNQACASSGVVAACMCVAQMVCNETGTFCEGSNLLVTCTADANGCLAVAETTCGPHQTCMAAEGCVCQPVPSECTGTGTACVDSSSLVTCATDANGCLFDTTTMCPAGKACTGSFPSASCG